MKKYFLTLCSVACMQISNAQNPVALENKPHTLQERHYLMKTNSESYQDYKVIKEYILDGVWKIALDSLSKREAQLAESRANVDSLQKKLTLVRAELKSKEDSMADIVFAGTHIHVFGNDLSKSFFLIITSVAIVSLTLIISMLLVRMQEMRKVAKECNLVVASINHEFDEFKHKAMEKQVKLARELQTERNKLLELLEQSKS